MVTLFHVKDYGTSLEALSAACGCIAQSGGTSELTPIHDCNGNVIIYRVSKEGK